MDDDDNDTVTVYAPRPFSVLDLGIVVVGNLSSFFDDVQTLMCGHANYRVQRRMVADQMRESIERIVGE